MRDLVTQIVFGLNSGPGWRYALAFVVKIGPGFRSVLRVGECPEPNEAASYIGLY